MKEKDFETFVDSLEIKILFFLVQNDNGKYLDMSDFIINKELLKVKLQNLAKEGLIYFDGGSHISFGDKDDFIRKACLVKIKAEGKRYLQTFKQTNSVSNHYYNNVNQIIQGSDFSNSQNNNSTKPISSKNLDNKNVLIKLLDYLTSNEFVVILEIIKILLTIG